MSKIREPALRHFAAECLAERLGAVCQHVEGVRSGQSIEAIHQMRVASRRLRAALEVFAPALPAKRYRKWRKQVRAVTTALGQARDGDVQIAFIEDYLADLPEGDKKYRPGIMRLHLRLTQQRQALQPDVEKAMAALTDANLLDEMPKALRRIVVQTAGDAPSQTGARRFARDAITARLDALLGYEPYVEQPAMVDQLHEMRIAAKQLRYTMEIFAPAYDSALNTPLKRIRKIQNTLGELHDLDVWLERLPQFIDQERDRTAEYFGHQRGFKRLQTGIEHLLDTLRTRRQHVYEQFVERWRAHQGKGTWSRLRRVLRQPVIEPAGPMQPSPLDSQPVSELAVPIEPPITAPPADKSTPN